MTAEQFISQLESQGLLPEKLVKQLRRIVEDAATPPTPHDLARMLVEKGHLTAFQAKKLLPEEPAKHRPKAGGEQPIAKTVAPPPVKRPAPRDDGLVPLDDEPAAPKYDELLPLDDAPAKPAAKGPAARPAASDELMPLDDDPKPAAKAAPPAPKAPAAAPPAKVPPSKPPAAAGDDLVPLDDDLPTAPKATPAKPAPAAAPPAPTPAKSPPAKSAAPAPKATTTAAAKPAAPADTGLTPLLEELPPTSPAAPAAAGGASPAGPAPLDDLLGPLGAPGAAATSPLLASSKPKSWWQSLFGGGGDAGGSQANKKPTNPWESPLILLGGGGVVLLLVMLIWLYVVYTRGSAQEVFDLAETDYHAGAYSQSIAKYDKFISSFPLDKNVSLARIRREIARLRGAMTGGNWSEALQIAQKSLPELEKEESMDEARNDLADILPQIYDALATAAAKGSSTEESEKLLKQAREAEALVNNGAYIKAEKRKPAEYEKISERLVAVERNLLRDKDLAVAITEIKRLAGEGQTAEAYSLHREFLQKYPKLERDAGLHGAVMEITAKLKDRVRVTEPNEAAQNTEAPEVGKRTLLAERKGEPAPSAAGKIFPVLVGGNVVALDASTGQALWQRHVGEETTQTPLLLPREAEADCLLVSAGTKELVCVDGKTGQLRWRRAAEEIVGSPMMAGDHVYYVTRKGLVSQVDPKSGQLLRQAALPQGVQVGLAADDRAKQIYALGAHTNLYVLTAETLACKEVAYVGHAAGSVLTAPSEALRKVLIPVSVGPQVALLYVLMEDETSGGLKLTGEPERLQGNVVTPMLSSRGRVLLVTDRGEIRVFDAKSGDSKSGLSPIAKVVGTATTPVAHFAAWDASRVWVAGSGIARYELIDAQSKLNRQVMIEPDDQAEAAPRVLGDVLLTVRRHRGAPGLIASARKLTPDAAPETELKPYWEVQFGAPVALPPTPATSGIRVISALAQVWDLPPSEAAFRAVDKPLVPADAANPRSIREVAPLPNGAWLLAGAPAKNWSAVFQAAQATQPLTAISGVPAKLELAAAPVACGAGWLLPAVTGPIHYIQADGRPAMHPYQPALEPSARFRWSLPQIVAESPPQFVVAEMKRRKLYRIALRQQPEAHLDAAGELTLSGEPLSSPILCGESLFIVVRGATSDLLASYHWPDLKPQGEKVLAGRLSSGPWLVGTTLLLATDGSLLACDSAGKERWKIDWKEGAIAGLPTASDQDFILATEGGLILQLAGDSGKVVARQSLREGLSGGATMHDGRILVGTRHGVVIELPWPPAKGAQEK